MQVPDRSGNRSSVCKSLRQTPYTNELVLGTAGQQNVLIVLQMETEIKLAIKRANIIFDSYLENLWQFLPYLGHTFKKIILLHVLMWRDLVNWYLSILSKYGKTYKVDFKNKNSTFLKLNKGQISAMYTSIFDYKTTFNQFTQWTFDFPVGISKTHLLCTGIKNIWKLFKECNRQNFCKVSIQKFNLCYC